MELKKSRGKQIAALVAAICLLLVIIALPAKNLVSPKAEEGAHITIASLKGPTSIGLAQLYQESLQAEDSLYSFSIQASADAIVPLLAQGKVDIALIPANLASILNQKLQDQIKVIEVNTLGVLSAVGLASDSQNGGQAPQSIADLQGKTIFMTGKGTVPQYTLEALLRACNIDPAQVDVQYKSEPAEVVASLQANPQAVAILPQPFVTAALMQNPQLQLYFDLTEQWDMLMGEDAGKLLTGVTVVRTDYLNSYPKAVAQYLSDHAASVKAVNGSPENYAQTVVDMGIVAASKLAQAAIPQCNLVAIKGKEMKEAVQGYLQVIFQQNPQAVGGVLPQDDFYYLN